MDDKEFDGLIQWVVHGLGNLLFSPSTGLGIIQRMNESDRISSQFELESVRQQYNLLIEQYKQLSEDMRLQKRLDWDREQLAIRFQNEERLENIRRETQLISSYVQLLAAKNLADDKEIREKFPLKTPVKVIIDAYKDYQENQKRIPLLVVISPPELKFEKFPNAEKGFARIEDRLIDEVQEFCKHYPLTSQERPVSYQGADWESKYSHGKSAIDTLHHVLKSVPTVVVESKVDGDLLRIYLAGWDMLEEVPHYDKVLTIPWKEVLYPIARKYAREWREYRMKLLDKNRSMEDIKRRGGDDELNLLILEEEEEDQEFGRIGQHDYKYNVNEDKYIQELAQFLGICHCILVGLVADRYHFSHSDVPPKLPELLPGLLERVPNESLKQMLVGEIVSNYQRLYQLVEVERPHTIPYLFLDLAVSLSYLPDKSWAISQVYSSMKFRLQLQVKKEITNLSINQLLESLITEGDDEYLDALFKCLNSLDNNGVNKVNSLLNTLLESKIKGSIKRYRGKNFRVVIAIDFGTSHSGYVWVCKGDTKIQARKIWPGQEVKYPKTPTLLLYNSSGELEEQSAKVNLIADHLKKIKELALKDLEEIINYTLIPSEIRWVLTVPDIGKYWDKMLMRKAAIKAGLIGESRDEGERLFLVLESEAAVIYCQERLKQEFLHEAGSRFMVANLTSSAFDITVREIITENGQKKLDYVIFDSGGLYGTTYFDNRFLQYLSSSIMLTNEVIHDFQVNYPQAYVQLMEAWEQTKFGFEPDDDVVLVEMPSPLHDLLKNDYPDILEKLAAKQANDQYNIWLSGEVMKNTIFAPDQLLAKFEAMFTELPSRQNKKKCDVMLLVGEFSAYPILRERIKKRFAAEVENGNILISEVPSTAILEGAVSWGLNSW